MQTLKDEVKNKIIEAAVEEFLVDGYASSSLRTIAAQAGITIGNIYSYFSSKEDLFDNVVAPAWEALDSLMSMDMVVCESKDSGSLMELTNSINEAFLANKQRFLILLNGSAGTKYENFRQQIEDFLSQRIQKELYPKIYVGKDDPLFARALSAALIAGFITVFTQYGGDEQRLNGLVNDLLYALLGNIQSRR